MSPARPSNARGRPGGNATGSPVSGPRCAHGDGSPCRVSLCAQTARFIERFRVLPRHGFIGSARRGTPLEVFAYDGTRRLANMERARARHRLDHPYAAYAHTAGFAPDPQPPPDIGHQGTPVHRSTPTTGPSDCRNQARHAACHHPGDGLLTRATGCSTTRPEERPRRGSGLLSGHLNDDGRQLAAICVRFPAVLGKHAGEAPDPDAAEGTRTPKSVRTRRPERRVFTNFTTAARWSNVSIWRATRTPNGASATLQASRAAIV